LRSGSFPAGPFVIFSRAFGGADVSFAVLDFRKFAIAQHSVEYGIATPSASNRACIARTECPASRQARIDGHKWRINPTRLAGTSAANSANRGNSSVFGIGDTSV